MSSESTKSETRVVLVTVEGSVLTVSATEPNAMGEEMRRSLELHLIELLPSRCPGGPDSWPTCDQTLKAEYLGCLERAEGRTWFYYKFVATFYADEEYGETTPPSMKGMVAVSVAAGMDKRVYLEEVSIMGRSEGFKYR